MKKSFITVVIRLALILFIADAKFACGQLPIDSIKYLIQKEVANKRSASIVVGIINSVSRQLVSAGKVSDSSNQLPDGNTVYEIGSITKTFTSLLLADMVIKNQLNLNDPISKFLPPSVKVPVRNGKEVTLLNLATHTSGLPAEPDNLNPKSWENPYVDYTVDQLYAFLSNYKLTRDIGSKFEYSNLGAGLLGHILSLIGGSDYETLVKQQICRPLNMNSTVVSLNETLKNNYAAGHNAYGMPVSNWDISTLTGCGGLRSTVNDLLTYASANLGLIGTNLSAAIELTHVTRDSTGIANFDIGMAWIIRKQDRNQIIWHNSETGGYSTFIGLDTDRKVGVVVLSNSENSVDDIGFHIIDPKSNALQSYHNPWLVLDTVRLTINNKGIDTAVKLYHNLKRLNPSGYVFNEDQLSAAGEELRKAKRIKEAIIILKLNSEEYPTWSAFQLLGTAYEEGGDKKLAIGSYQKSIRLNPDNNIGRTMLQKIKKE